MPTGKELAHDRRPDPRRLWPLVTLPVVVWATQELSGWAIASHSCLVPHRIGEARLAIALLSVCFIAVSVGTLLVARRLWHAPRGAHEPASIESSRYISGLGIFFSLLLGLGLLFGILPSLILPACGWAR